MTALIAAIRAEREMLHRNLDDIRANQAHTLQSVRSLEGLCKTAKPPAEIADTLTRLERLSPRQRRVLERVVAGEPNKAIAYDLGLSEKTVETHRSRVMRKLGARSFAELVRIVSRAGRGSALRAGIVADVVAKQSVQPKAG